MSDSEAIMWAVEKDPALRSDFCNLTVLESPPDPDRLRAKLDEALRAIPRLRQRVVSAPLPRRGPATGRASKQPRRTVGTIVTVQRGGAARRVSAY